MTDHRIDLVLRCPVKEEAFSIDYDKVTIIMAARKIAAVTNVIVDCPGCDEEHRIQLK